jgi:hypothetical protein
MLLLNRSTAACLKSDNIACQISGEDLLGAHSQ